MLNLFHIGVTNYAWGIVVNISNRSTEEVFEDHLRCAKELNYKDDMKKNYSENCIILTTKGKFSGYDGITYLAELLNEELPNAKFEYTNKLVEGKIAFLEWKGEGGNHYVNDGTDSFVIENGRVIAQTIHYTVKRKSKRN